VLLLDSASNDVQAPGVGIEHAVEIGVGVGVGVGVVWQKMSWLKVTSESRMSALRRRCALTEGLICFFTSRVQCTHHQATPLWRETPNCVKTFLKIFEIYLGGDALAEVRHELH
jgi:hypothetical protein